MSAAWRIELQLANKEDLAKVGKAKQSESIQARDEKGRAVPVLSQNDKTGEQPKHNTRSEIAKAANTSAGMLAILTARSAWDSEMPSSRDAARVPDFGLPPLGFVPTWDETGSPTRARARMAIPFYHRMIKRVAPRARIKPPPGRGKPGRGALPVQRWVPVTGTGD